MTSPAKPSWIDADAHVLEPRTVWERVDKEFRDRITLVNMTDDPEMLKFANGFDVFLDKFPIPVAMSGNRRDRFDKLQRDFLKKYKLGAGWEPTQYLKDFDIEGIYEAVIYPTLYLWAPWIPELGAKFSEALCRAYNDWMREFCATDSKRLKAAAVISLHDVQGAIAEAKRIAKYDCFVGVFVRPNPLYGRTLGHPDYLPLYKELENLNLTVGIHEGQLSHLPTLGLDRSTSQWVVHCMSHPFEQMAAMASLNEFNVFEEVPKLNFLFLEAGTAMWAPYWLNRLDAERKLYRMSGKQFLLPSEYFERQGFVTCEADDPWLKHMLSFFSDKKLLFSTDYPHMESPYPNTLKTFLEQEISEESRKRIGADNARAAYPRLK